MSDTSNTLRGGGWGDVPSNDPAEREGTPKAPGVNKEPIGKFWTDSSPGASKLKGS